MPHPLPHHHPPTISLRSCFIAVGSLLALHAPGVVCEEATKNLAGSTLNSKARREGPALRPVVLDAAADAADVLSNVSSVDSTSFGQTLVDAVNAASTTETFATCTSGFTDLTALKTAACAVNATVAWDGFDAAYAAAGTEITPLEDGLDAINELANSGLIDPYTTNGPLRTPTGCNFGCIPTMKRENDPLGRVAATLPWRGKCFDDDTTDPVTPTDADGNAMPDSITVPLVANVRVARFPNPADCLMPCMECSDASLTTTRDSRLTLFLRNRRSRTASGKPRVANPETKPPPKPSASPRPPR
jgi:hypothetical protein